MADFPTSIYTPRTKQNRLGVVYDPTKTRVGYAEDVTKLDDEVVSIETILGLNPQGASASVGARISALDVILNKANLGAGYLMRWDGSKFVNSNIFQDANGNEGIGTTGPAALLHVSAVSADSITNIARFLQPGLVTTGKQVTLAIGKSGSTPLTGTDPVALFGYLHNTDETLKAAFMTVAGLDPATGGAILINKSGNVGIGTTNFTGGAAPELNIKAKDASNAAGLGLQSFDGTASLYLRSGTGSDGQLIGYQNNLQFGVTTGIGTSGYVEKVRITSGGNVGIGTIGPTAKLDVLSDILRLRTAKTPASAGAAGNAGDICWDSGYLYICISTNSWVRSALTAW